MVKKLNQEYLKKYCSDVSHHKRSTMKPLVLLPGNSLYSRLFLSKTKYPHLQPLSVTEGPARNRHGSPTV